MAKFYAVKVGRNPGVYRTWDECKKEVEGYKGASYRSFSSHEEALNFVQGKQGDDSLKDVPLSAYIDGSFDKKNMRYSYGAVVFYNNQKFHISGSDNDERFVDFRNVAGEIIASTKVIQFALNNNIPEIAIYYDYAGIEKWATREWKRNNALTIGYSDYVKSIEDEITIHFIKVKAHSGHQLNDEVDLLAKRALKSNDKHYVEVVEGG